DRPYFSDLVLALQNTFLYGPSAVCFFPNPVEPGIIGEIADLLIRAKDIKQLLCAGRVGQDVLVSARTTTDGGDALALCRRSLKGFGYAGGHGHRAGGRVPLSGSSTAIPEDMQNSIRANWLKACGVSETRGVRLVSRKEILDNL
ncbi:MAG: hypothetical protein KDD44_05520, partial [Bdellovibrionales bacterium]|nr:hypothetical protein [Bdellovibrionales bacterium]